MKKTLSLIGFIFIILSAKAQHHMPVNPIIMVDSIIVPYNLINYIKTDDIKALDVQKNSKDNNDGIIYFTLKDHQVLLDLLKNKMMSLNDIQKKYVPRSDQKRPVIFVLDSKMLTDTAGIKIPAFVNPNVQVIKAEDTPYFKKAFPGSLILMIHTAPPITIRN